MAPKSSSGKSSPSKKSTSRKTWNHIHLSIFSLSISLFLSAILAYILFFLASLQLPDITTVVRYRAPAPTTVRAADGTVIDSIYNRKSFPIRLDEMPSLLPLAFIAAEDARFKQHRGIDFLAILRAFIHNLRADRPEEGGSTITQQTARMLLLNREKSYIRKIKEAILAVRIEQVLSKEEIIRIYLNRIYLGEGAYGVEAASRIYFGKHASELDIAEIAILAGLPQAPSLYSPFKNFTLAKRRQAYVLNRMSEERYITSSEAKEAYRRKMVWASRQRRTQKKNYQETGYFCQQVRRYVTEKYGKKQLQAGGLTIYTTLDLDLQEKAVASVRKGIAAWEKRHQARKSSPPQAALAAIEVGTGQIRALVGGTGYSRSQFDRATQARRQPGSAFKPFIYAAAFEQGYTPVTIIQDKPIKLQLNADGRIWQPHNFSGEYFGPTTLYTGLVHSRNIVAVKLLQQIGIDKVKRLARHAGITSRMGNSPALALGTSEVSLLELTAAYTVFANQGRFVSPVFVERIEDREGRLLERNTPEGRKVLSPETAFQITTLLEAVIREGTGKLAWGLQSDSAGKTGTTDDLRDGWFIGYTPALAAGIWMGFDRGKSLGEKETGGRACAPVWLDFMKKTGFEKKKFPAPAGITFLPFDRETGNYNPDDLNTSHWLPFRKGNLPWDK